MITFLQRQHVSRRTAPPVHLRARTVGVSWRNVERPAAPVSSPPRHPHARPQASWKDIRPVRRPEEGHSFLKGQLVRRERRRELRTLQRGIERIAKRQRAQQQVSARRGEPERSTAGGPRSAAAIARALRSPWLVLGLVCAAAAVALAPAVVRAGMVFTSAHPALPLPDDNDRAIYSLLVPEPAGPQDAAVSPVVMQTLKLSQYQAQNGDSLSRIAARFKLNVDTLVSWNDIANGHSIAAGTQLAIPNRDGLKYRVRRGDTLQGIASAFGVDFNGLLDANMLASSVISVGQELFVPGARLSPTELGRILGNLFMYPVIGPISSYFGGRPDPFTGASEYHNGIDIVNKPGTPILASMAGTVAQVGWNFSYGNYVILKHAGNYQTLYGHMTRYIVANGQKVQQGQKIGELGTTGYSTGPHVHFSVFHNGQPVDPLRFLK
jgi:murein DD-endopeptidase MepM/ murein hydrolase activator NlpD